MLAAPFALVALAGCKTAPEPPRVVKVPIAVACEIEQVPESELPQAAPGANVFELTTVALARLKILMAENTRLRAANNNPCPGGPQ